MSNYANTKATIAANVYENHLNQVTANMAKAAINSVVDSLIAGGFLYKGVAHPGDAAVSPDANVFYIASEAGTYTNKGGLVVADGEVAILKYNGSWSKEVTGAATAAEVSALGQEVGENLLVNLIDSQEIIIEQGNILYGGANQVNLTRVRSNQPIPASVGWIGVPEGLLINEVFYYSAWTDAEHYTFVQRVAVSATSYKFNTSIASLVRFTIRKSSGNINPSEVLDALYITAPRIEKIENDIQSIYKQLEYKQLGFALIEEPARKDGSLSTSGYFKGYEVDLSGLYPAYKYVYFRGANFSVSGTIVRGIILDGNNAVENYVENAVGNSNGWQVLPITANSAKLRATYCISASGGEVWSPEYVQAQFESVTPIQEIDILKSEVDALEDVPILPAQIHAVSGEQLFLFKNAILPTNFGELLMSCAGGRNFARYMNFIPNNTGDIPLSISYKGRLASSIIKVVNPGNPASKKNILIVGSSTTANYKTQFEELFRRLHETSGDNNVTIYGASVRNPKNPKGLGLTNVAFVGRLNNGENFKYEATGGYSWSNYYGTASQYNYAFIVEDTTGYVNGAVYTDGTHNFTIYEISAGDGRISMKCATTGLTIQSPGTLNKVSGSGPSTLAFTSASETLIRPFLNPNTLQTSLQYYMSTYCNGEGLDIIYFNGLIFNSGYDWSLLENYAKPLFRIIHTEYPSAKIIIGSGALSDTKCGLAAVYASTGISGQTTQANAKLREYIQRIDVLCYEMNDEFGAAVCIPSCLALQADADYDYPVASIDVDNRNTATEEIGTNGNHPTNTGILNHIDAIYRSICYVIATYFN